MKPKATTPDALQLLTDGWKAFADIEANGIAINERGLSHNIDKTQLRIDSLTDRLKQSDIWEEWKRRFGKKTNLGSRVQLGKILGNRLPSEALTPTGRAKVDNETLSTIDDPFEIGRAHV